MKRAPLTYRVPARSKEQLRRIRQIERAFHVRVFGEELARANFEMTIEERHRYLEWMRETARQCGVRPAPRAFDAQDESGTGS